MMRSNLPMVDYSNIPRDSRRVPLETRVQFKFDRFTGFISEYSANISPGGMFIRTRTPQPPGTVLDLEFRLGDGFELIKGTGEVVWGRTEDEGSARPAGMGLRFLELSQGSKDLIYRIVDQHIARGGTPFDVMQRPPDLTPAAPAPRYPMPVPPAPPPVATPTPFPDIFDLPPPLSAPRRDPRPPAAEPALAEPGPSPQDLPEPLPLAAQEPAVSPPVASPTVVSPTSPAPMFAATFGSAAAREPRRALPWVLLAVGLVLVAGAFLARDRLTEWMELAGSDQEAAGTPVPPPRRPVRTPPGPAASPPGQTAPPPSPAASTVPAAEGTPATSTAGEAPASPPPAPAPPTSAPVAGPNTGPALSQLDRITWETPAGETDVVLWGNGTFSPGVYSRTRLDGNPPRELIRLSGIHRPYPTARVVVGSSEVLQVRLGYHPEAGRGELHVVLDLARPEVVVAGVEPGPHQLRIRLRRK